MIWDPAAEAIEGLEQVFVVPDGPLNLVDLSTLPVSGGRYLLETAPRLHYMTAERDLILTTRDGAAGKGLLIVGDPDFDSTSAVSTRKASVRANGSTAAASAGPRPDRSSVLFDSVPGAGAEMEEVADLWARRRDEDGREGSIVQLRGSGADEATFKREATRGYRIIHIATHGFFPGEGFLSGVAGTAESAPDAPSPFVLTGLVLAGANRRFGRTGPDDLEDGMLTAEEIASLDLRGVQWAVLSACGTGLGPIQPGEGVLGLRRAFQVAGARTVIMSLWAVNDHAARDWIRRLYASRLGGAATAEAVRRASLSILRERRDAGLATHPYYWGGFVAAGDWR